MVTCTVISSKQCARFYHICSLIDTAFAQESSNRQPLKLIRNFVRRVEKLEKEKGTSNKEPLSNKEFEACLDMMKEAKIVKQAGSSLLHLKSYSSIPETYPYPSKKGSLF